MSRTEKFLDMLPFSAAITRREFLKRSVVMGAMIPVAGTLLASCGGDDDDDDGGDDDEGTTPAAESTRAGIPTNVAGGQPTEAASPDATEAGGDDTEPTATAAAGATEPAAEGEAAQGGSVIMMGHHEIASLSPDDDGPTVHWVMTTNIHNSMVELDSYFVLQPVLCESWEVGDDGLSYTFKLHEGVLFHDGEEFNAEDVKYTFEYYGSPENAAISASNFRSIAFPIETPDDYTVVINLNQSDAAFLAIAAQSQIVAQHHHSAVTENGYKADPMGTGPFKVKDYDPASFCELEAFEDHFRGRPNLDILRENIVPEASVRTISLESGEADTSVWSLLTEDNIKLRDSGDFTTFVTSSVAVNHFPINNERPYFQDKVVRQAMMHAIDRDQIVDELWQGLAVKATANLSPALQFYYEPDVKQYEYDPELAMSMLDEAGWVVGSDGVREKDGVKISWTCLVITGDQARRPEAEVVQQWMLAIGLDMKIEEAPSTSTAMSQGDGDMALYNWTYGGGSGEPDASNTLRSDALNNFSHYKNPEMDALLDQGLAEPDENARKEIYSQVQKLVAEDVPFLFIKFWDWFVFFNTRVKGLPEDPLTTQFYNEAYKWWVDDQA